MSRVDVFYSLQSDYCYFLLDRLIWLSERADVVIRPVLPGLIRNPERYADRGADEVTYFAHDTARLAEIYGMPYRYPDPSPVAFKPGSLWVPDAAQPRVHGLYNLFVAATLQGRALAYLDQVMRLIWDGRGVDWTDRTGMDAALGRAGLERVALEALAEADIADELDENHRAMTAAGHWGVPLMLVGEEPFYGQDRFEHVLWRLGLWSPAPGGIPQ